MRLMRLNRILLVLTFFTISLGQSNPRLITCTTIDTDHYTKEITITFTVPKKDFIYKDFITFSVDDPTIVLSSWKANKQSVAHYDSSFKEAKQVFNEDFSITMLAAATPKQPINSAYLYCSYYRRSEKKINHALFLLDFTAQKKTTHKTDDTTIEYTEINEPTISRPRKISPF